MKKGFSTVSGNECASKFLIIPQPKSCKHMLRMACCIISVTILIVATASMAIAETPLALRFEWVGPVDYFTTGETMAADTQGTVGAVDALSQPASVEVTEADLASGAILQNAYLYWAGSVDQPGISCAVSPSIDDEIIFTPPDGLSVPVTADSTYCSDGGSVNYDVIVNRSDVTNLIDSLVGTYMVDGFSARTTDAGTDNASFSVVLVYAAPMLSRKKINLYDGIESFQNSTKTFSLTGIEVDNSVSGKLTWYVLDGDLLGGNEFVSVAGQPLGLSIILQDIDNPANNPMNSSINTQTPSRTNVIGVDIDEFPIGDALSYGDTSIDVTYTAGSDKWWLTYQVVGVDVNTNADIEVAPSLISFGNVEVGSPVTQLITVDNVGVVTNLTVADISMGGGSDAFSISSAPATPLEIAVDDSVAEIQVTFTPPTTGSFEGQLVILSDDPDESVFTVNLGGVGITVDPPPSNDIDAIIKFYDAAIESGDLIGLGPGKSAEHRAKALRNMLLATDDLIQTNMISDACNQLQDAVKRTDNSPRPPDFVDGVSATGLADQILGLMLSLECN